MKISPRLVRHVAVMEAFGLAYFAVLLILMAHAHGGRIVVDVAAYGERYVEVAAMFVLTPVLTLGMHYYLVDSTE